MDEQEFYAEVDQIAASVRFKKWAAFYRLWLQLGHQPDEVPSEDDRNRSHSIQWYESSGSGERLQSAYKSMRDAESAVWRLVEAQATGVPACPYTRCPRCGSSEGSWDEERFRCSGCGNYWERATGGAYEWWYTN